MKSLRRGLPRLWIPGIIIIVWFAGCKKQSSARDTVKSADQKPVQCKDGKVPRAGQNGKIDCVVPATVAPKPPPPPTQVFQRPVDTPAAIATAKKLNSQGLEARRGKNHALALQKYQAAVNAAPGYAPARFNLACELALEGDSDAALNEIEFLSQLNTESAKRFIAVAPLDSDLNTIQKHPRFLKIQTLHRLKPDMPILAQLCSEPWRVKALVHPEKGLHQLIEKEAPPVDDANAEGVAVLRHIRNKRRAQEALRKHLSTVCDLLKDNEGQTHEFTKDKPLGVLENKMECAGVELAGEWGAVYEICFVEADGLILVTAILEYPYSVGLLEDSTKYYEGRVRECKARASSLL